MDPMRLEISDGEETFIIYVNDEPNGRKSGEILQVVNGSFIDAFVRTRYDRTKQYDTAGECIIGLLRESLLPALAVRV